MIVKTIFSSHLSDDENNKFIEHINSSCGCESEVFCYKNFNQYSLTEIYNKALKEIDNTDSIFVFCHNDVLFKTKNWGNILLKHFNKTNYDIIGVAGTPLLVNGQWWSVREKMLGIVEHTNGLREWISEYSPSFKGVKPVAVIDGLFMACNPENIIHKFNENYKGFHFYDISWSFENTLDGCNVGVVSDIRILHKSIGMVDNEWYKSKEQFEKEFKNELPFDISKF